MPTEHVVAFAPGRVNLIGEHTDYNHGLALAFAIADGVTVRADAAAPAPGGQARITAHACDLNERDEFDLGEPTAAEGWRAFVRGSAAELARAGFQLTGARLLINGHVPPGAGLSSSAALEVALCLALIELGRARSPGAPHEQLDRTELARLCSRVENQWVGAHTGLLDQLASLYGAADTALCIDFNTLCITPVPLALGDWRLVVLDSGEPHVHARSGYNQRRAECARACQLLGVSSLAHATAEASAVLPQPLRRRVEHVIGENQRVRDAVDALHARSLPALGALLNASHASLRDRYEVSTPAVEATVERLLSAGAAGARVIGGGFGGSVLALLGPNVTAPEGAREVRPSAGARLLEKE